MMDNLNLLKIMFNEAVSKETLSSNFEKSLDTTASSLIIEHKDKSILPAVCETIFNRNRQGTFYLYLLWSFFESRDPEALVLIANKLLSSDQRDVELSKKILDFIPLVDLPENAGNKALYNYYINWIKENKKYLIFTGESYQFTSKPCICFVDEDAKNLYFASGTAHAIHHPDSADGASHPALEAAVTIGRTPLDYEALLSEYPPNSIERSVLEKLNSSTQNYKYDSLEHLRFELRMRKEIVNAAKELHRSGMGFEIFTESRCNPDFWDRTNEGGFRLKNGVKASDAIADIFKNGHKYGTECATAMVIIYYKALLNIFPEDLFNKTFKTIHLMNWHYLDRNLREIGYIESAHDYLPGDRRYVKNPDVDPRTPQWQGENLIDLDNNLYYGHGIGIMNIDGFIRALNRNRREGSDESAFLMPSVSRPDFRRLANIYLS